MVRQKRVIRIKKFADGLLFEFVSSLGYFCLNRLNCVRARKKSTQVPVKNQARQF
jgi:hypothetical protein